MVSSQFLSKKLTDSLIKSDIIYKKSLDIYTYCFEYIFDIIIFHGSLLVIGLLTNSFIISLFYICSTYFFYIKIGSCFSLQQKIDRKEKKTMHKFCFYDIIILSVFYILLTLEHKYKICECIICSCSFVLIGQFLELRRIRHESENCTM